MHGIYGGTPMDERYQKLNFSWLRRGQLAGACQPGAWNPLETDLTLLRDEGVRAIVNLRERPYVLPAHWQGRFDLIHSPMDDFSVPSIHQMQEIVAVTDSLLNDRKPVVFHCMAGIGRTGIVLAALLMVREGKSADQVVKELAPHGRGPQSDRQHHFLFQEWARHLNKKKR